MDARREKQGEMGTTAPEANEADLAEQQRVTDPADDAWAEDTSADASDRSPAWDADEADVRDQDQAVPMDDDR